MDLIEFKNLPDTSTPLNAETLNSLQTNIENEFENTPKSLYNKNLSSNTTLTKTLEARSVYILNMSRYSNYNISNINKTYIIVTGFATSNTSRCFLISSVGSDTLDVNINFTNGLTINISSSQYAIVSLTKM